MKNRIRITLRQVQNEQSESIRTTAIQFILTVLAVAAVTALPATARASSLVVAGGPSDYDQDTGTGLRGFEVYVNPSRGVNNSGTAVGTVFKEDGFAPLGKRAVRWDGSGTAPMQLDSLGSNTLGIAYAINDAGTAVGYSQHSSGGFDLRAVR